MRLLAVMALFAALIAGCSSVRSAHDTLDLDAGSCVGSTRNYDIIPADEIVRDVVIDAGGVQSGATLIADGPRACIYVDNVGNDVTLLATGYGATIFVGDATSTNLRVRATGERALVVLFAAKSVPRQNVSVSGKDARLIIHPTKGG